MRERVKTKTAATASHRKTAVTPWYVYLLECAGGRLYAGVTPDLEARYAAHCAGRGARFTRSFPPRQIVALMPCKDRSAALRAEAALKKLRRPAKLLWASQWPYDARPMQAASL